MARRSRGMALMNLLDPRKREKETKKLIEFVKATRV
jgi:hypothetical protein